MDHIPLIKSVMTPFPYSVDAESPITDALSMMAEHEFSHLPVRQGEALVGVVSEAAVKRALEQAPEEPTGDPLQVRQVMVADPYVVDLKTPLDSVVRQLADRHIDYALVVRQQRLVGIFTSTDAFRLLGEHLRSLRPPKGDDAA